MDSEFSELDPEIEQIHFQKRYNALLKIMYEDSLPYPFEHHLIALERRAKQDILLDNGLNTFRKQSALINLKVVQSLKKEYQAFKLISQ